jgi:hypothetical protein
MFTIGGPEQHARTSKRPVTVRSSMRVLTRQNRVVVYRWQHNNLILQLVMSLRPEAPVPRSLRRHDCQNLKRGAWYYCVYWGRGSG